MLIIKMKGSSSVLPRFSRNFLVQILVSNSFTMRKASSKLISQLAKPTPKIQFSLPCRDISSISNGCDNHSSTNSPKPQLKSCSKSRTFLFSASNSLLSQLDSSHYFNTLVDPTAKGSSLTQFSSRQKRLKNKSDLEEAFESADSIPEMLEAFQAMEECFEEKDLGLACLKLGLKLDREGEKPEMTLSFAQRALDILDDNDSSGNTDTNTISKLSLPIAMALQLLGSVCFALKRFSESLAYLNRASRLLRKLEVDSAFDDYHVLPILHAVQFELFNVKTAMGRREEAISHLKIALEIKEKTFEEGSREIGKANRDVAEAYVAVLNFKEALPYCLKGLEIHTSCLGNGSVEVAHDRRLLGVIYSGLEEHEKALEQNQLSQKALRKWGRNADVLRAEIDAANMQIALGRDEEAIETLKGIIPQTEQEGTERALVFVSMGKALCNQEKSQEAKKCLDIAVGILEKKVRSSPFVVTEAFTEISMLYESMNEFEVAISLLRKTLKMLERLPQEQHSVGTVSARIGWLLMLTGKVEDAIPCLEDAAERLKESFGSKHYAVGYVYNNLGGAYMEMDRPQSAAQVFAFAKDIMDVSLGPHHMDSIEACQNLSKAYAAMSSYTLAINFQEKVVDGLEGHGPSVKDELDEAVRVLDELREKATDEIAEIIMDLPFHEDGDDSVDEEALSSGNSPPQPGIPESKR